MESTEESRNCVIDAAGIRRKLKRMALEVAEQNSGVQELVIAAINGNGEVVARHLIKELEPFFKTTFVRVILNKKDPLEVSLEHQPDTENKVILLVDDVANSGRTMLYALKPLLEKQAIKIQTLVLVERSHKLFPVQTDYKGLSIATTLQEHIAVETDGENLTGAWLY
jgi:pyrimidine operon attenuation protein / uracil phosphoribosyltransferase